MQKREVVSVKKSATQTVIPVEERLTVEVPTEIRAGFHPIGKCFVIEA